MRYAKIINGIVQNVIIWDGLKPYPLADGESLVPWEDAKDLPLRGPEPEPEEPPAKTVAVGGLTLRAEEGDRKSFVELLVLLREAEGIGMLPETTVISDAAGTAHELPTGTVRQILVGYGSALQAEWLAAKQAETP